MARFRRVCLELEPKLYRELAAVAHEMGISVSVLLRHLVINFLYISSGELESQLAVLSTQTLTVARELENLKKRVQRLEKLAEGAAYARRA